MTPYKIIKEPFSFSLDFFYHYNIFFCKMAAIRFANLFCHNSLIFSQFVKHLDLFKQHFKETQQQYTWLSNATPTLQREKAIQQFEKDTLTIEEKILLFQAKKQHLATDMINYKDKLLFSKDDLAVLLG